MNFDLAISFFPTRQKQAVAIFRTLPSDSHLCGAHVLMGVGHPAGV